MQGSSHRIGVSCRSQRTPRMKRMAVATLMLTMFATACPPPGPPPSPLVPTDAQDACPLSAATFAGWFETGSVTLNGVVNPADSLKNLAPNCGFYEWSEQMFMWLTSPAPPTYGGGGGRIFNSPVFFDVSPPDANGIRTLLPHTPNLIRAFPVRSAQVGAHGLPVVMARSGRLLEVERPAADVKPLVRDQSGKLVEIVHVRLGEDGRPILLDKAGRTIEARFAETAKRAYERPMSPALTVQKFIIDRVPLFIDPSLAVIDVEQGQAEDSGVLEAQTTANGSLVYYATIVNDVYAYFLTGFKDGAITTTTPNQFPTTPADLNSTIAFATAHGKPSPPFPDPNALAVEVKASWVIAAGLPNLSSYITMNATIPTYNQSDPHTWTPTGQQTVELALVGMHVVGSTLNHPELVWATFEHGGNTPLATYSYNSTTGPQTVSQNPSGTWLFSANGSLGPFNILHMTFAGPPTNNIQSSGSFTISPSDTLRSEPWGIDGSNASSNTEVISMNNHVRGMIAGGDVRGNYIMTGATWVAGGGPPSTGFQVGTNQLSNATMETYQQGSNCFSCHSDPPMLGALSSAKKGIGLSHIFGGLQPLF